MLCFDTNVVLYLVQGLVDSTIIKREPIYFASVARIEALGFKGITAAEEKTVRGILYQMNEIPLREAIIERAVLLRQLKRMSLGDAIVAATALEHDAELWTANTEDFAHIDGLKLVNPLEGVSL